MSYFAFSFILMGLLFHIPFNTQIFLLSLIFIFALYLHEEKKISTFLIISCAYVFGILYFIYFRIYPGDLFHPIFYINPQERSVDPGFRFKIPQHTPKDIEVWLQSFLFNQAPKAEAKFYKTIFKQSGLLHVLVISGSHITMFYVTLNILFQIPLNIFHLFLPKTPSKIKFLKKTGPWVCLILIWIYCSLVGFSPPIQRAFIMSFTLCCATGFEKKISNIKLLYISFNLQILAFPRSIFSLSTLLSWSSLLLSSQIDLKKFNFRNILKLFYIQFLISIVILILCESFSFIGIFANILLLPLNGPVLVASMIAALSFFTPQLLNQICYEIIRFYIYLVSCFAEVESWHPMFQLKLPVNVLSFVKALLLGLILKSVLNSLSANEMNAVCEEPTLDGSRYPKSTKKL